MLTISKTVENGKAILFPEGRLDSVTAPEMEKSENRKIKEWG